MFLTSDTKNSEVVFDYIEPSETFSEEMRKLLKERTKQLEDSGEP